MKIRSLCTFLSDLPEETVDDDDLIDGYDCLPGANVANAVAAVLNTQGVETGPAWQEDDRGWVFDARWRGHDFFVQVTELAAERLLVVSRASLRQRLFGDKAVYPAFLDLIHSSLGADSRFHDLKWYVREDYDRRPAPEAARTPTE